MKIPPRILLNGTAAFIFCAALSFLNSSAHAQALAHSASQEIDRVVAIVNQEVITRRDLDERTQLIMRKLQQQKMPIPPLAELEPQVLEQMALERIQLQKAQEEGIDLDDVAVQRAVERLANGNHLTIEAYRKRIEAQGIPWALFKHDVKSELMLSQLRQKEIDSKITVSDAEVANYLARKHSAPANSSASTPMPSASPQQVQTQVRHILIRIGKGISEQKARQQLLTIKQKIKDGGDFAAFARTYSQDGSASQGGNLGWLSAGETVPEFEQAFKQLKEGEVSAPVRTEYGYHLIQVLSRRSAESDNERETVRQAIGARKAEQAYANWLSTLRDSATVQYKLDTDKL